MAWTTTTWANVDWAAAATLNEFVGAVNERKSALGQGSPFATVVAGDDVQAASFFAAYQAWIEANLGSFVVSHIVGDPWVGGHYNGETTIDTYANLAAVFSAAGLNVGDDAHTNWRRYTTHPDEAGGVAYGQRQASDIMGPWILEDIQKCLNVLVWTKRGENAWQGGDTYSGVGSKVGFLNDATWNEVKAQAEAAWARTGDGNAAPGASSRGWTVPYLPPDVFTVYAALGRVAGYGRVVNVWNGATRYADWYIETYHVTPGAYNNYGDLVIEDKYSLWLQDEPATNNTTIISSAAISDASVMPNTPWVNIPPAGQLGWDQTLGGSVVVLRWNVLGGFTYA